MGTRSLLFLICVACTGSIGDPEPTQEPRRDTGPNYPDGTIIEEDGAVIFPDGYVPPPESSWVPLRRLTDAEYSAAVRDALALDLDSFEEGSRRDGAEWHNDRIARSFGLGGSEPTDVFRNHTPELTVGVGTLESHVEAVTRFSEGYARWWQSQPETRAFCEGLERAACIERYTREIGAKMYRRPLLETEVASLLRVYRDVEVQLDEDAAFEALVLSLLLSPQTLYLFETDLPEFHAYHVASRLAFYLWRTAPDETLRAKAADGTLLEDAVYEAEVERMMAHDRFYAAQARFFEEVLDLTRFESFYKDPNLDGRLDREGMFADFASNVRRVYEADGTFEDLLTGELVFSDPQLVAFLNEGPYPGILAHPVFTWTHASYRQRSPIERGVTVLERLIRCDHLPPPPMNVAPLPSANADATLRERLAVHREDPACAACHDEIDPIGLTFQNYDHFGAYVTSNYWWRNGIQRADDVIDASGALVGTDNDGPVDDLGGLVRRLAGSRDVQQCFADQSLRYAVLRTLEGVDESERERAMNAFVGSGLKLRALVREIALSPLVRFEQEEEGDAR